MPILITVDRDRIEPRPYQVLALAALNDRMSAEGANPCVVIPTGGGKSILMAWAIQTWKQSYPPFRCCILAHRKELVEQNSKELECLCPGESIGVYAAGLKRRDMASDILFASIDSIFKRWGEFPPFDCVIVDEAHRIPASGEGKYRQFIQGCQIVNPKLKVIGFTATPFRMSCGPICHPDHILNEICYEANVGDLIRDGYLCNLRSKVSSIAPDVQDVKRNSGGDYIRRSLAEAVDTPRLVQDTIRNAVSIINTEQRKSIIFFCVSVEHCRHVSQELAKHGINAPSVTGTTPQGQRDHIVEQFKAGRLRAICNINVFTEGFNAERTDCIVLLRPTLSKGLYTQMPGRGLRLHPEKDFCLILDYAKCIEEHGPLDSIDTGRVRLAICGQCGDVFSWAIRECPHCGWRIPAQEVERAEAEDRERRMHEKEASELAILASQPQRLEVDDVSFYLHVKPDSPHSLRIQYRSGLATVNEWVCLDHPGYAGKKAREWWANRWGWPSAKKITVEKALQDMFLERDLARMTKSITVVRDGKYPKIEEHELEGVFDGSDA